MKCIVAVSGGVDSVTLLDMLVQKGEHDVIVAHFDHGIRPDSAADAQFVEALAKKYGLPCYSEREELGAGASEELARKRRYIFLRSLAREHAAKIMTAHHGDDLIETIAINITRGTGWRGLAVFGAEDIKRPLLGLTKKDIYNYALEKRLEWVEDSTNASGLYLRNRLRARIAQMLSAREKHKLQQLWKSQTALRKLITTEEKQFTAYSSYCPRHFFIMMPENIAKELLRAVIWRTLKRGLLEPQLQRGILAIKTARAGTVTQLGGGVELHFKTSRFVAREGQKML